MYIDSSLISANTTLIKNVRNISGKYSLKELFLTVKTG